MNSIEKLRALLSQVERWEPQITEALRHGNNTHTFDDVVGMIMANRVLFFSFPDCFYIAEKVTYPQYSTFHCFLAGGDLEALISHTDQMREVGKQLECKYFSLAGRKGWERVLEARGWKQLNSTMQLPIEESEDERRRWGNHVNGQATARN